MKAQETRRAFPVRQGLCALFLLSFMGCEKDKPAESDALAVSQKSKTSEAEKAPKGKLAVEPERAADLSASVVTMIGGEAAECLDLKLWGEEALQEYEVQAWRDALVPKNDADTRRLTQECGATYSKSSPKAVCVGSNQFERDGMHYRVSITTSHYSDLDLKSRALECKEREGRWLQF